MVGLFFILVIMINFRTLIKSKTIFLKHVWETSTKIFIKDSWEEIFIFFGRYSKHYEFISNFHDLGSVISKSQIKHCFQKRKTNSLVTLPLNQITVFFIVII